MLNQRKHFEFFKHCRNESLNKFSDPTNNLIIRLDKLINDFRLYDEDGDRKDFERRVVPWLDNSEFQHCSLCKVRFSLTRRRHHCRLCGTVICGGPCTQFLSFSSSKKLTGLEFSADVLTALSKLDYQDNVSLSGGDSVDKPRNRRLSASSLGNTMNSSINTMKNRLGLLIANVPLGGIENGKDGCSQFDEPSLRICRQCKSLLERRERTMELRMANSVFVDVYQKLCSLLSEISKLAPSYRNMIESLNNGETLYTLDAAVDLRKKMIGMQREITSLSERIEQWGLLENDPLVTHKPTDRELLMQKNIKMLVINSLHELVFGIPDLPTPEKYELLKEEYRQRIQRQIEQERERQHRAMQIQQQQQHWDDNNCSDADGQQMYGNNSNVGSMEQSPKSRISFGSSTTPILIGSAGKITSLIRDQLRPSSSNATGTADRTPHKFDSSSELTGSRADSRQQKPRSRFDVMRPSSSFTGGMANEGDSGWVPERNALQQQKLNPFFEDELAELHPIQEQYLITKGYLEQAAKAGRLDEVEMLERNVRELELDLKRLELDTPRGTT